MRLALLSDVHGTTAALDAVLADVERAGGADAFWVLGDLAALGPEPVAALERLAALPNAAFCRGNTDRYVAEGAIPDAWVRDAQADGAAVPRVVDSAATFAWTRGMLTATGWLDWLAALPLELRAELPDGSRLLGVHASPGRDDGDGVRPGHTDAELAALLDGCGADLVCTGHTHVAVDRELGGVRAVNLGSLGLPPPGVRHASYVLLEAVADGVTLEHRAVEYDRTAVVEAFRRVAPPGREFLLGFYGA